MYESQSEADNTEQQEKIPQMDGNVSIETGEVEEDEESEECEKIQVIVGYRPTRVKQEKRVPVNQTNKQRRHSSLPPKHSCL